MKKMAFFSDKEAQYIRDGIKNSGKIDPEADFRRRYNEYVEKNGGAAPEFYWFIIYYRCFQSINKKIKKAKTRAVIRLENVLHPYEFYSTSMIDEIYVDLENYFLKQQIEIDFEGFNPGSVVRIEYLSLTLAPKSFRKTVIKRIRKDITSSLLWNIWPGKNRISTIHYKDIMGPYLPYSESEYTFILDKIISLHKEGKKLSYKSGVGYIEIFFDDAGS